MASIGSNKQSLEFISNYKPDKIGQRPLSQTLDLRNSQAISLISTLIAQLNSGLVGSNNTNTERFQVLLNSDFIAVPKPTLFSLSLLLIDNLMFTGDVEL